MLKAGGLALIVGYDNSPHNVGRVVRLVEFMPYAMFDDGEVKTNAWVVFSENLVGRDGITKCPEMIYRQEHLKPLDDENNEAHELSSIKKETTCNTYKN